MGGAGVSKVDPVALVNNLVGAMMSGGGGVQNQLANLGMAAMATAAMQGSQGGGYDRSRGFDRDRKARGQRGRERSPGPGSRQARSRSPRHRQSSRTGQAPGTSHKSPKRQRT